jgi:hypothetical protein
MSRTKEKGWKKEWQAGPKKWRAQECGSGRTEGRKEGRIERWMAGWMEGWPLASKESAFLAWGAVHSWRGQREGRGQETFRRRSRR